MSYHMVWPERQVLQVTQDTLRCAQVSHAWHHAANQPEALVRAMRLSGPWLALSAQLKIPQVHPSPDWLGDDSDSAPEGLRRLLGRGCLKRVELVEIAGACTLTAVKILQTRGVGRSWQLLVFVVEF